MTTNKRAVLILCCLAQFMVILDVAIVNVALPSIRSALSFHGNELQWVVNAYTLAFGGFLLLGGRSADLLGRRQMFIVGMGVFALASLVGATAADKYVLIGARALQGLGGAIVAPATLSILSATFAEGAERNKALGAWGAMGGVGGAAGGLLGGVLTEELSWRWILLINVPIGALAILAALKYVAAFERKPGQHFDVAGAAWVTAGLVVLTYGIVGSETHGWGSARTLVTLAVGVVLIAIFLYVEARRATAPLMPLRIFKSRRVVGANLAIFGLGASSFGMWYFVSQYLQDVMGYSPIRAGIAFLPMTAAIIICSTAASRIVTKTGPGPVLTLGMVLNGVGLLLFTGTGVPGDWLSDVLLASVLTAAGIGFSFVPATIAAVTGVGPGEAGLASGLLNTSRQVGGSLGLAILATLAASHTRTLAGQGVAHKEALTDGFHVAFAVGAGFAFMSVLASIFLLGGLKLRRRTPEQAPAV